MAYRICCLNATYINLSTISEVHWSPRATMISAVASVCLWAGSTKSLARAGKWTEVTRSLWPSAWRYQTGSAKQSCLKHTIRGWDCLLMQISAWPRLWCAAVGQGQLGLCFPSHEPMALRRVSTRIKVSIPKHGNMANPIEKYNLRLNSPI